MEIDAYKDLQRMHTFGVPWQAAVFCAFDKVDDVVKTAAYARLQQLPVLILGGGSNILPTQDWGGLVIKNEIRGREVVGEDENSITIRVGAGENWDALVRWCVEHKYYGLENMVLIPGTVGGAVVQNIGAYDVDLQRFVECVDCIDLHSTDIIHLDHGACEFAYRTSLFKKKRGQYMVTHVTLKLSKQCNPVVTYQSLQDVLCADSTVQPTAMQVMQAVISIRESKLPDWNMVGTAGSFFANPKVGDEVVNRLRDEYPDMPVFNNYDSGENTIPAGWLIEHAEIDAVRKQKFLYEKHHLIVVNNAKNTDKVTGKEIFDFTQHIQEQVQKKFGIQLHCEVVVL